MYKFRLLMAGIMFFFVSLVSAQTNKNIVQIHHVHKDVSKVLLNIPKNKVTIERTKGSRITVEISIQLNQGTTPLLDYLIGTGRYDLKASIEENHEFLTLSPLKNQKVVLIKGQECLEHVEYTIQIPESIKYVQTLETDQNFFIAGQ